MIVRILSEAIEYAESNGYPVIISPTFSLNGAGVGTAIDRESLTALFEMVISLSPLHEVFLESLN